MLTASSQPNSPYHAIKHGRLTIEGWSRAMIQTCFRVPELDIGFDIGALPWDFLPTSRWFISHCHIDHLAALPVLVSRRNLLNMSNTTVLHVPAETADHIRAMLHSWIALDRGPMDVEIIPMSPGVEVRLTHQYVVTCVPMVHTVPALGYIVHEVRKKLRQEFVDLPPDRIRELRQSGADVSEEVRIPTIAYTGDTSPDGLDRNPILFDVEALITEMSFMRPNHPRERIHAFGHMHIDDFLERADRFRNQLIIAGHVSSRYDSQEVRETLERHVPPGLRERLRVWM